MNNDDSGERDDVFIFIRKPKNSRSEQTFDTKQDLADFLSNENLFVSFDELVEEHGLALSIQLTSAVCQFNEDGDVLSAIDVMTLCKVMDLYPPTGVMNWVSQAFWDFMKDDSQAETGRIDQGKQYTGDMNKLLGITGPGKPINSARRKHRNKYLYVIMGNVIRVFGVSAHAAAKLIYQREMFIGTWRSCVGLPDPSSIERAYSQLNPKPHEEGLSLGYRYPESREHLKEFAESFDVPDADRTVIQALMQKVDLLFPE
ncbi:MAG: hypothetical protein V7717_00195 [Porticoccaceae bacterium]